MHHANLQGGLMDGGTFDFMMKEGPVKRVPCKLSNVNEAESLTFSGRAMGGAAKCTVQCRCCGCKISSTLDNLLNLCYAMRFGRALFARWNGGTTVITLSSGRIFSGLCWVINNVLLLVEKLAKPFM